MKPALRKTFAVLPVVVACAAFGAVAQAQTTLNIGGKVENISMHDHTSWRQYDLSAGGESQRFSISWQYFSSYGVHHQLDRLQQ